MFPHNLVPNPSELRSTIVRDPLVVSPETTVMAAIAQMSRAQLHCTMGKTIDRQPNDLEQSVRSSCVMVVEEGHLIGILTEQDVVRLSAQQQPLDDLVVRQVMAHPVLTLCLSAFTDVFVAINLLQQHHIRHLPIVDEQGRLAGIVTHESLRQVSQLLDLLRLRLVEEVMTREVICAEPETPMLAIAQLMANHTVSSVVIVEPHNCTPEPLPIPVGILTERDLVQFQALGLNLETCTAARMMSTPLFTVTLGELLWTVQQIMKQRLIRRVAVTGTQGELLGIVTQSSVLQALNPLELYNLAKVLETKVVHLEAEKLALLENRTLELEQQVAARTAALQANVERERLLTELATQLRSSLSLQTILETTVAQVRQVLTCDRVNVWQFVTDGELMVVAESPNASPSLVGERVGDTCFQRDRAEEDGQKRIRVVPDIYTTQMSDCHRDLLIRLQTRAKILVPLLCGDRLWGFLNATEKHPRDWQPEEVELLQALSVHLAIALQQATTYQQLRAELQARQQAEARLRASEQRYASLVAAASVGIFRIDAAGHCTYINDRGCQISGLAPAAAIGQNWQQGLYPDDRSRVVAEWERSIQERRPFQLEYRLQRPDGTTTWVYGQIVAEQEDGEPVSSYVGTMTDVDERVRLETERQRSEAALRQSEAQSQAILSAIPDLMIRVGAQGEVRGYITQHRELDVIPQTLDSVGMLLEDILPADIAQRDLHYIQIALATGELQMYEQRVQVGDRWQDEEIRVIKSGDDEVLLIIRDITERKRTEAALQQSEQMNRIMIETMPDLLIQMDRYGRYTRMAGGRAVRVKYPTLSDELEVHNILSPDLAEQRLYYANRALESSSLQVYEQVVDVDGEPRCEEVRVAPLTDQEVLIIVRDITDQKQAEADRLKAEKARLELKLLEQILDVVLAGYWDWDIPNHQEYLSPGFKRMFGYADDELPNVPESWQNLVFPEDLPLVVECLDRHVQSQGKIPFYAEIRYRHKDGSTVWVICSGQVIEWDAAGHPRRMIGCHIDISDRKRAEIALQVSETRFRQVFASNVVGMMFTDFSGQIVDANDRFLEIIGYTRDDLNADRINWVDLTPIEHQANDRQAIAHLEQHQVIAPWEKEYYRKDGSRVAVLVGVALLSSTDSSCVCVVMDISDRKRAQQLLEQQAQREVLLREITQRIRQSLDLQTIFDTACQEIRSVIQADRVAIFKFYPDSHWDDGEFVAESVVAGFSSVVAVRIHDHCFGERYSALYAQGRFQAIDDIYDNGLTTCHTDILAQFQVQANLVMPLLCGEQLWGLLCVHQCGAPRHWQQTETNFVQQLANQLAIAIQQANLYEQIQSELLVRQRAEAEIARQLQRQQALGAIVQQIRDSLDIGEILATVTQQVKEMLHSDRVIIFQLFADGRSRIVEEAVSSGFPALKAAHWDDEVWSEDILHYYWQGQPRIVPDVMADIWTDCLIDYNQMGQIQSKIVAPILQDIHDSEHHRWVAPEDASKLWGVLVVHACQEQRVWQESEAQLLQQIANQLSIAIQQASLFEQLQQELQERLQAQQQLTERNQQLAISNQELARATRLKDEFLANMSHELRTPLNAVLGMTEGLQEAVFGPVTHGQITALQTIERSGSHLLELINDILDVAKIESGQMDLNLAPTAVAPLCQSSLAFIKQQALKKRIQLGIQLPIDLPEVLVDERRIRQVLINLLNNAVKFTPEQGSITLRVTCPGSASPQPDGQIQEANRGAGAIPLALANQTDAGSATEYLRIAVIDTGIGIAPEDMGKLFQPFIQIDSALNRQYSGTGLGLALVKRIVELHGGDVGLTSQLGQGSCFMISLPCVAGAPSVGELEPLPTLGLALGQPTQSDIPLILLAEDNDASISTVSSYLEVKGYRLLLAKSGQEAIALANSTQPDLILMDIQMPGMDGLEAMQQIRRNPALATVPMIALTALAMEGDRDRCLAAGATEYLSKPVKLKQLAALIHQLLHR